MSFNVQDIYLIFLLLFAGMIAGYAGALFGIGGGTVLVPILLAIFPLIQTTQDISMHMALGTSLALLVPNTLMSALKQYKMHNMDFELLKRWIPFVVGGAVLGTAVIKFIPALYLKLFFTAYLYSSFLFIVMKKNEVTEIPGSPRGKMVGMVGSVVGLVSVLLGMGGGTFSVPFTRIYNYPMKKAIAFSSVTGIFIGIIGTVGVIVSGWGVTGRPPYSLGFVSLLAFVIIVPAVLFFSPYGVKTANILSRRQWQWIYSLFLLIMAIYMTFQIIFQV